MISNLALFSAYICAIAEAQKGIPNGHLYAVAMEDGVELEQHQCVVSVLVNSGMVTHHGHLLQVTEKGQSMVETLKQELERQAARFDFS